MTVIHMSKDKNFLKHFLKKQTSKQTKPPKQQQERDRNAPCSDTDARTESGRLFAKGVFLHHPPPPFGDLCIHIPAPDKRNRAALEPSDLGAEKAQERGAWLMAFWLASKGQPGEQGNNQRKGRPVLAFSEGRNESWSLCIIKLSGGLMMKIWRSGITRSTLWGGHDLSGSATLMFICT